MSEYYLCPVCSNLHDLGENKAVFKGQLCIQKHVELTNEPIIQLNNGTFLNLSQNIYNFLLKNKIKYKEIIFYTYGEVIIADDNTYTFSKSTKRWNKVLAGTACAASLINPVMQVILDNE